MAGEPGGGRTGNGADRMITRRATTGLASRLAAVAATLACLGLAGCGTDGVELNGKLFDAMGVSSSAQAAKREEPRMPTRSGLVVPPSTTASLPVPGSGAATAAAAAPAESWPTDPEVVHAKVAAAEAAELEVYCNTGIKKGGSAEDFEDLKGSKAKRCGNIWSKAFNSGIYQPETTGSTTTP